MDRTFELSTYQKNILNYIQNDKGNLLIDAKAGSGKTSTLILVSDYLAKQDKKSLFLAFNKSIVDELSKKIDTGSCMVKTIHSLGFTFIKSYLYKKHNINYDLIVESNRLRDIVKHYYRNNMLRYSNS